MLTALAEYTQLLISDHTFKELGSSDIMASPHRHDAYQYDPIGSTRGQGLSHQHSQQNLHRVASRQLDNQYLTNNGLYTAEDHAAQYSTGRYDNTRLGAMGYSYGASGAQTWNPSYGGGASAIDSMTATGRLKTSRSRPGLPSVSSSKAHLRACNTDRVRLGWIRLHRFPQTIP